MDVVPPAHSSGRFLIDPTKTPPRYPEDKYDIQMSEVGSQAKSFEDCPIEIIDLNCSRAGIS